MKTANIKLAVQRSMPGCKVKQTVMKTPLPKISNSDCHEVMKKELPNQDIILVSHRQLLFEEINGYLGDHSILEIEIEKDGKKKTFNFFVKALPHVESQKSFLLDFNGFFKEKQFFTKYQFLLEQQKIDILNDAIPVCYFVNDELFVFKDLTSQGYITLPSRVPLTVDCIKMSLSAIAKLHASGLVLEELRNFRLINDFGEELKESFYLGSGWPERGLRSCKTGLRALIDLTHREDMRISKELFTEKVLESCDLQKVFAKPSTKFRNTICHADLWTKNLMFKFEEGKPIKCVVVDFQTYRYGPPAQDFLTFIYLVSDRETRKKYLNDLLRFYYLQLKENFEKFYLKDVVSEKEFFESCDYFRRFALTQNLLHFQVVILSNEIAGELFADQENVMRVLFEDKYEFFKDTCEMDPIFRDRNFELIEEFREYYEKQLIT